MISITTNKEDWHEKVDFPVELIPHSLVGYEHIKGDAGQSVVRMDTEEIITNVSSNYQFVKHIDILDAIEKALEANSINCQIVRVIFHGRKDSSIKVVYMLEKQIFIENQRPLNFCIMVNNSYDTLTKFHLTYGLFVMLCTNGIVIPYEDNMHVDDKVHIYENIELTDLFVGLDNFLENQVPLITAKLDILTKLKVIPDVEFEKFFNTKKDFESFLDSGLLEKYYEECGNSRYAQLQALTEFAQTLNGDSQIYVESNAYKFLSNN